MADDEGGDGGEAMALGPAMGPVYEMWENALEKLKILHYETGYCGKGRRPLSRVHFVYPGPNPGVQFEEFVDVCAWLCSVISRDELFKRDQYDDPNTVVNKLLLALRTLGFTLSFPSQKLKTANGEAVCGVLDFLADKALAARRFKWGAPVYADSVGADGGQGQMQVGDDEGGHAGSGGGGKDGDGDGDIEDEAAGALDDDVVYEDAGRNEAAEISLDTSAHNILQALVDPVEWKTELERVGPKLKVNQTLAANEWRAHVDQTISSKSAIDKVLGDTQGDLQVMNKYIAEELTRAGTKEKYMNHQFSAIVAQYQESKKRLEEFEGKSGKVNEKVAKLTNELAELTDKLEELKESFESRDSGIHDTSPLVRIKSALQQIKQESCAFDLRIGVVSHLLLAARVSANKHRRANAHASKHKRNKKAHEDSVLSDD